MSTLYDKLWSAHEVCMRSDGKTLLYIDRQLLHEVTSPQAFEGLRDKGRALWRKASNKAMPDHAIPTSLNQRQAGIESIADPISRHQVQVLDDNCRAFEVELFALNDNRQGIVHVVGPEQGLTLPGMTVVCGDSHTSTHGALAALAFGIGTSEVEHVLATQCLPMQKSKNMRIEISGDLHTGVYAKDVALWLIGALGASVGSGYAIEFSGSTVRNLSMEGRMSLCNMAVEAGARSGLIAFDDCTAKYVQRTPMAPRGADLEKALTYWRTLSSDDNADFDRDIKLNTDELAPQITWGTNPAMVTSIDGVVPNPAMEQDPIKRQNMQGALDYMGLRADTPVADIDIDEIFIGSCTNGRIEDLRIVADIVKGKHCADNIKRALVVPGSAKVRDQAQDEGLDKIFTAAGMEWRAPGCSMCLGMNDDCLGQRQRCATTSNRNFEGRQGYLGRSHLLSPATAAASAITGHFTDPRTVLGH